MGLNLNILLITKQIATTGIAMIIAITYSTKGFPPRRKKSPRIRILLGRIKKCSIYISKVLLPTYNRYFPNFLSDFTKFSFFRKKVNTINIPKTLFSACVYGTSIKPLQRKIKDIINAVINIASSVNLIKLIKFRLTITPIAKNKKYLRYDKQKKSDSKSTKYFFDTKKREKAKHKKHTSFNQAYFTKGNVIFTNDVKYTMNLIKVYIKKKLNNVIVNQYPCLDASARTRIKLSWYDLNHKKHKVVTIST